MFNRSLFNLVINGRTASESEIKDSEAGFIVEPNSKTELVSDEAINWSSF